MPFLTKITHFFNFSKRILHFGTIFAIFFCRKESHSVIPIIYNFFNIMCENSNDTGMMRLNRIAIVCNSPVNQSKKLNSNPPDYKAFATAKSCGFNVVMYPGSEVEPDEWIEYMDKALIHCKKLRIKLISNSPILNYTGKNRSDWPEEFAKHYIPIEGSIDNLAEEKQEFQKSLDALIGWQIKDEPLYYDWTKDYPYYYKKIADGKSSIIPPDEVTPEDLELLGKETEPKLLKIDCGKILDNYNIVKRIDSDRPSFCNLAVDNNKIWIGHHSTYEEYLDEYIATFRPPLLSFDYYPIDTDKSTKKPHLHKEKFLAYRSKWVFFSEKNTHSSFYRSFWVLNSL